MPAPHPLPPSLPLAIRLTRADVNRVEAIRRRPVVVRARGMGHQTRTARSKVKNVETNLGTAAAKFDAGLASLAVLQRQSQQQQQHRGLGNDVVEGFNGSSGRGGLVRLLARAA